MEIEQKLNHTSLRIFSSKKLIVFSKPKVATRFLNLVFKGDGRDSHESYAISRNLELISANPIIGLDDNQTEFSKIIDIKKNKKEIIFLYRNPLDRFITGVVQYSINQLLLSQHWGILLLDNPNEFTTPLPILLDGVRTYLLGITLNKKYGDNYDEDLIKSEVVLLSEKLINRLDKYLSMVEIPDDVHTENYLSFYDDFIQSGKFDLNKITLINIGDKKNNLSKILNTYDSELSIKISDDNNSEKKLSTSNTKGFSKKILTDAINSNKMLLEKIHRYVEIDTLFYNRFETSELNILHKK